MGSEERSDLIGHALFDLLEEQRQESAAYLENHYEERWGTEHRRHQVLLDFIDQTFLETGPRILYAATPKPVVEEEK